MSDKGIKYVVISTAHAGGGGVFGKKIGRLWSWHKTPEAALRESAKIADVPHKVLPCENIYGRHQPGDTRGGVIDESVYDSQVVSLICQCECGCKMDWIPNNLDATDFHNKRLHCPLCSAQMNTKGWCDGGE